MSFLVSVEVPQTKLSSLLAALKDYKAEVEWVGGEIQGEPDEESNGRTTTYISLGSREPAANTNASKICGLIMAMEGKVGAGNVDRKMLNAAMTKAKLTKATISTGVANAVTAGYLRRDKR